MCCLTVPEAERAHPGCPWGAPSGTLGRILLCFLSHLIVVVNCLHPLFSSCIIPVVPLLLHSALPVSCLHIFSSYEIISHIALGSTTMSSSNLITSQDLFPHKVTLTGSRVRTAPYLFRNTIQHITKLWLKLLLHLGPNFLASTLGLLIPQPLPRL
jgi:hypothetical protein